MIAHVVASLQVAAFPSSSDSDDDDVADGSLEKTDDVEVVLSLILAICLDVPFFRPSMPPLWKFFRRKVCASPCMPDQLSQDEVYFLLFFHSYLQLAAIEEQKVTELLSAAQKIVDKYDVIKLYSFAAPLLCALRDSTIAQNDSRSQATRAGQRHHRRCQEAVRGLSTVHFLSFRKTIGSIVERDAVLDSNATETVRQERRSGLAFPSEGSACSS